MRPLKRVLVFLSEIGVFLLGLIASSAISFLAAAMSGSGDVGAIAFYGGFLLSVTGFFLRRRKTRVWKIAYDSEGYRLAQIERKSHPRRARCKRFARRTLI